MIRYARGLLLHCQSIAPGIANNIGTKVDPHRVSASIRGTVQVIQPLPMSGSVMMKPT